MNIKTTQSIICFAVVTLLGSGCVINDLLSTTRTATPTAAEPPVYPQTKTVVLAESFEIRITKCYWGNELEKPGFANLPEAFRQQQRSQWVAKPQAKFLVVEFSLKNLEQEPMTLIKPPMFVLKNARGTQYASVAQDVNTDSLFTRFAVNRPVINPGMFVTGKEVYDIPKDDYLMHVSFGEHAGGWEFRGGPTLFKWSLAPTE